MNNRTKTVDGVVLVEHDRVSAYYACGECGRVTADIWYPNDQREPGSPDAICAHCGSSDTDWLPAEEGE